jgi:hypothetical protein
VILKSAAQNAQSIPAGLEEALRVIREKVSALPFGTLTLTVHEGRVTQLEISEKRRFAG